MFPVTTATRRLIGIAAAVAVLGLAACSDNETRAAEDTSPAPTTSPAPATTAAPATTQAPTTTAAPATTQAPTTTAAGPELIKVTAENFRFDGVPTELATGSYRFAFANTGSEPHELVIFRNPEGLTLEELHTLGPEEGPKHVELAVFIVAEPGLPAAEPVVAELTPGEYEVACFIPTPTDDQPHFTHGMHTKITVG